MFSTSPILLTFLGAFCATFHWILLPLFASVATVNAQYSWQKADSFDRVRDQLDSINGDNCKVADVNKLFLQDGSVSHIPNLEWLGINPVFPNRTSLLQIHNMALSRAFFLR